MQQEQRIVSRKLEGKLPARDQAIRDHDAGNPYMAISSATREHMQSKISSEFPEKKLRVAQVKSRRHAWTLSSAVPTCTHNRQQVSKLLKGFPRRLWSRPLPRFAISLLRDQICMCVCEMRVRMSGVLQSGSATSESSRYVLNFAFFRSNVVRTR